MATCTCIQNCVFASTTVNYLNGKCTCKWRISKTLFMKHIHLSMVCHGTFFPTDGFVDLWNIRVFECYHVHISMIYSILIDVFGSLAEKSLGILLIASVLPVVFPELVKLLKIPAFTAVLLLLIIYIFLQILWCGLKYKNVTYM